MLVQDLFIVLILALIFWAWWIDRGIKQNAYALAKQHCEEINVQLLDDNVRLEKMTLKRNARGSMSIERRFKFEFTSTGERRHQGQLTMLGKKLEGIDAGVFLV